MDSSVTHTAPVKRITVGLFAESFGFGPASKVIMIAKLLAQQATISFIAYGTTVTKEFFEKEGYGPVVDLGPDDCTSSHVLRRVQGTIDLAIVGLQPEWACALQPIMPVVYLDSLGFMWEPSFFKRYSQLRLVDAYCAQNLFNAEEKLKRQQISNLNLTGPIISLPNNIGGAPIPHESSSIAQLGGLINIFSNRDGIDYGHFVLQLLNGIVDEYLTSTAAAEQMIHDENVKVHCLSHEAVLRKYKSNHTVFTSPGLTTLLELAALGCNVIPLPPQNYSQALIVRYIAKIQTSSPIWNFLATQYDIGEGLPEEQGVHRIRQLSLTHRHSNSFWNDYRELIPESKNSRLPFDLGLAENGAGQVVEIILNLLRKLKPV